MQFARGFISPYFVTNLEKSTVEMEKPFILLCDRRINTFKELLPILEPVFQSGQPLLIIAEDIEGEAIATLVTNKLQQGFKIAAVKAPGFGDKRTAFLEDIAVLVGATVISEDKGVSLASVTLDMLGSADKIEIDKDSTTLIRGFGSEQEIAERVAQIKSQMESTSISDFEKASLQERLAKLSGGIAILYVGATTEIEMREKKDRVDDALAATRAAVEEGIVPGGGVALIRCIEILENFIGLNEDENTGIAIIRKALEEPLRQIIANAGGEGAVIVQKVKDGLLDFGYNARTEVFENLYEAGVIDPTKVTRTALENAASIASMILTTECVIVDEVVDTSNGMIMPG
jgi:chaperonin GroEL